jgi:hypothetical protein
MAPRQPSSTLRYTLAPDDGALHALQETFKDYALMMEILAELATRESGSNLVVLHGLAYEAIRARTRLPSRLVTLGLRDFAARRGGEDVSGVPLDHKLYALKSASSLTISTVFGRVTIPFDVSGYLDGWKGALPARLIFDRGAFELRVGVTPNTLPTQEKTMMHEGILSRAGRLIAGVAHATIDKAEGLNAVAVIEQAIREIDGAAEETRADLGKARAEEYRIKSRRQELTDEITTLDGKIRLAMSEKRDDLARAGVAHQIDLESQIAALDKALANVGERIDEGQQAMQAVIAARRDAEARLSEFKLSEARHGDGETDAPARRTPKRNIARATATVARLTGVPGGAAAPGPELDELERLHRERAITERLARFKSDS